MELDLERGYFRMETRFEPGARNLQKRCFSSTSVPLFLITSEQTLFLCFKHHSLISRFWFEPDFNIINKQPNGLLTHLSHPFSLSLPLSDEKVTIFDQTEVNLVAFRRTIYLAIQSRYARVHTHTHTTQKIRTL